MILNILAAIAFAFAFTVAFWDLDQTMIRRTLRSTR